MPTAAGQSVALCMIVRNEEPVIERCLTSVRDLVDRWVICDTGSSDRTPALVSSLLADLPGELHETTWVDFGHNRSELMRLARGTADYLLLIDADMTVIQRAPLGGLTADAYLLRETGALDFAVVRLVRGDRRWWYDGASHEHVATDGSFSQEQLDALLIDHHADGSSHEEKLYRDLALLKRDLARTPDDARTIFYLAQTFRDLGMADLAVEHYRRRVALGGWDEEVFYANLQEGTIRARADFDGAVPVLLEAWQRRSSRAEPLYELAHGYRMREDYELAHLFADRGLQIPYPSDVLFVHRGIYQWGLRLERALAAEGLERLQDARDDLLTLLREENLPRPAEQYVARKLADLRPAPRATHGRTGGWQRLASLAPSVRIGEVELDVSPPWPSFNPSISTFEDRFRMIVRTANYEIERGVVHEHGILQNVNYLLDLDADLRVVSTEPIVEHPTGIGRYPSRVQGYEDCRLFSVGGRWFATATCCELNEFERREIALLDLDGPEITRVRALPGPNPGRTEKNWMPFVLDDTLHFVYRCGPATTVLRCDVDGGAVEVVSERPAPELSREFRGGSQGVPVGDGNTLFVVHEVDLSERAAQYVHRFVMLDRDFRLEAASPPFTFAAERVEFCAGMAQRDGDLVLSFGVSDAAAGLAVIARNEALGLLESV